jgi:hypothetical protein
MTCDTSPDTGIADAPPASDNETPATPKAFFKRLRFETVFLRDIYPSRLLQGGS